MADSQSERQRMVRRHHWEKKELQAASRASCQDESREPAFPSLKGTKKAQKKGGRGERARLERTAAAEREHLARFRHDEEEQLAAILEAKNLEMKDMPANGHCLNRAIQDQLGFSVTGESLRRRSAEYLRKHLEDFLPFFRDSETGDAYSGDDCMSYCDDTCTARPGRPARAEGPVDVLQTPIEVIQADSPVLVIGEEDTQKPLTLVYRRYSCSREERCHSVKPVEAGAVGSAAPCRPWA
ncbi:hypothetical protein HPG69_019802 [Diceros bicornis minor]|uniref:OTU domain-containing protein n=1 Tax=Diceros bicornis minor TaxID=77932 RepID=A0A7J7ERC2_DICBM|nr:hypothetical protein HPG69_019802 [Diceros bicornis minor]